MAAARPAEPACESKLEEKPDLSLTQSFSKIHAVNGHFLLVPEKSDKYILAYNAAKKTTTAIPVMGSPLHFITVGKEIFYEFSQQDVFQPAFKKLSRRYDFIGFTRLPWPNPAPSNVLTLRSNFNFSIAEGTVTPKGELIYPDEDAKTRNNLSAIDLQTMLLSSADFSSESLIKPRKILQLSNGLFMTYGYHEETASDLSREICNAIEAAPSDPRQQLISAIETMQHSNERAMKPTVELLARTESDHFLPIYKLFIGTPWNFFFELPEKNQLITGSYDYNLRQSVVSIYNIASDMLTHLHDHIFKNCRITKMETMAGGDILVGHAVRKKTDGSSSKEFYFTWSPNLLHPHLEINHVTSRITDVAVLESSKTIGIATNKGLEQVPFSAFVHLHQSPAKKVTRDNIAVSTKVLTKRGSSALAAPSAPAAPPPLPSVAKPLERR